jgi:uncharacterized membrane protein YjjB (DUF3815 family)
LLACGVALAITGVVLQLSGRAEPSYSFFTAAAVAGIIGAVVDRLQR